MEEWEMTQTVMIEEAELQQLIQGIEYLLYATGEVKEHRGNPDEVKVRCLHIIGDLYRMREFLTFLT
jgi:hypothetical protein